MITLTAFGNEAIHYLETADGYTVMRNADGNYEYAIKGLDGNLTLSGIKASNATRLAGKTGITPHLRYSAAQASALMQYHESFSENAAGFGKAGANVFPPEGNRKILVLLIEYPDLRATVSKSNFELLFNQPNYNNTGSFKDYYLKASFGKLSIDVDVYGWYMATKGYKNYGQQSSSNYSAATKELLVRAATAADSAGVDFSGYDTDNDGYVDAVMVLHAGMGAEEASAPNSGDYIWSFRSTLSGSSTYDNKKIYAYAMFPEKRYSGNMVGIGVISHEFGHILDLPDLYATAFNGGSGPEGVGNYANMAGGPWLNNEKTPCMHDAWSKITLGWLTPVTITQAGTYTIPKAAVDSNFAFRINTSRSNEYFLLENKQRKTQDLYLPSKGLAIWHVNSTKAGRLSTTGNNANNDTSNLGLGLLQADGRNDLEIGNNRGDAGDLYPGSTNNKSASPTTNPSTNLYYKVTGFHQPSGIYISNITVNPDSSVTFRFGAVPNASYTSSATSGCVPLTVSFTNSSSFASSYSWSFGDGTNSTQSDVSHVYNTPGSYDVWLRVLDTTGTVVDSSKQTIQVFASPTAAMNILRNGNMIKFVNNSTDASSYIWKFGSFTSFAATPDSLNLHDLQDSGLVKITLIAFSSGGCTDTTETSMDVWKTGIAEQVRHPFTGLVYPNPVEPYSVLSFSTAQSEHVSIDVFNMLGERVASIENGQLSAGAHEYALRENMFPAKGVYIIRISTGTQADHIRVLNNR